MAPRFKNPARPSDGDGRKRPATLADVAAMAGVVPMTASRALNKSGYVSAEVMERVTVAARKLQYRPNVLARQLRGSRLKAIGILLPDIANPYCAELMRGIAPVLRAAGYTAFIATAPQSVDEELAALQSFIDHRTDGVLVATRNTPEGDDGLREAAERGMAIATIGRPVKFSGVDCVYADHYQGAYDAVMHLVACGHQRIGYIGASIGDATRPPRFEGFLAALLAARIPIRAAYAVGSTAGPGFATEEDGYSGMMQLAKLDQPPTALCARNDYAAIGALRAAHDLGLRVPHDIAIAGFDNVPTAAYQNPALTTVGQPIAEQGRLAAEMLIRRMEGGGRSKQQVTQLPCDLIVRGSTQLAS